MENKVSNAKDIEKGKIEWKKQQNEDVIRAIKSGGGTIYHDDGTPYKSYVSAQLSSPDAWYYQFRFPSLSDCQQSTNFTGISSMYAEGNGCNAWGGRNHATGQYVDQGSYEVNITSTGTTVFYEFNDYASFDCTGTKLSTVYSYTKTENTCDSNGNKYMYTTDGPLTYENSPLVTEIVGLYADAKYAMDNPDGNLNYITLMN